MRNWIERNDLSWMEGSVWAKKKSSNELDGSNRNLLLNSDSIKLATSIRMQQELPDVEIKYKSDRNDRSVFNPSDICQQANQIYNQMNNMLHIKKAGTSELGEIQLSGRNRGNQGGSTVVMDGNASNRSMNESGQAPPKKRIFGLGTKKPPIDSKLGRGQEDEEPMPHFRNNLVTSVIHEDESQGVGQEVGGSDKKFSISYSEFDSNSNLELSP